MNRKEKAAQETSESRKRKTFQNKKDKKNGKKVEEEGKEMKGKGPKFKITRCAGDRARSFFDGTHRHA